MLLSGNEALALGAYEAGLKVAAAYPGAPSTEIVQNLSRLPDVDTQWSVNEKVAFEVALSAAIGGVRSLYVSKHVGLNVAMDPLMTSAYTGVNAGFVIISCDDLRECILLRMSRITVCSPRRLRSRCWNLSVPLRRGSLSVRPLI
jgi:indolepyruvate ferredoxin oxidoreductase, alpha subunit